MNARVHVAKMVPTAGLEPAQVAPLAPQTSASTNFATSACQWPIGQTRHGLTANFYGVRLANPEKLAALRAEENIFTDPLLRRRCRRGGRGRWCLWSRRRRRS